MTDQMAISIVESDKATVEPRLQLNHRYEVLDGMRGIAAIIVMTYHCFMHSLPFVNKNSYTAVDFFFILSGFVIMHSYGRRLAMGMSPIDYILRRVIRLYPMAIIGVLLGTLALYLYCRSGQGDYSLHDIVGSTLSNALLLPYFNNHSVFWSEGPAVYGKIFPGNGSLWSIFFEMVASLAFIGLVRLTANALRRAAILSLLLLIAAGLFFTFVEYQSNLHWGTGWSTANVLGGFPRVFYGFICGMLLYKVGELPAFGKWWKRLLERARSAGTLSSTWRCLLIYGALGLCLLLPFNLRGMTYLMTIGAFGPLLIILASRIELSAGPLLTVSKALGWLSYPIYCLQDPVLELTRFADQHYALGLHTALPQPVIFFGATFILAIVAGKLVDEPIRRYLSAGAQRLMTA
jgi:peptidoglycan/LPS O-acetylase OafA/YrhL